MMLLWATIIVCLFWYVITWGSEERCEKENQGLLKRREKIKD